MKSIPTALDDNLNSHASTLATLWKVVRTDGVILGFTNYSKDVYIDGVLYVARTGYTPTAIVSNSNLSVDNLDLEGILSSDGIIEEDVIAGVYDYADITVYEFNYNDASLPKTILRRGTIGELTLRDGIYISELRGMSQKLVRQFLRIVTPTCDAEVFDTRCQADPANFVNTGTVTNVFEDRFRFSVLIDGTPRSVGFFDNGLITFTTGAGQGRSIEIDEHEESDVFRLNIRFPWTIAVGDLVSILAGCDKSLETCQSKFNNIVNFRGFNKVPGNDAIFKTPNAKG